MEPISSPFSFVDQLCLIQFLMESKFLIRQKPIFEQPINPPKLMEWFRFSKTSNVVGVMMPPVGKDSVFGTLEMRRKRFLEMKVVVVDGGGKNSFSSRILKIGEGGMKNKKSLGTKFVIIYI